MSILSSEDPLLMGILNSTPDSFSDGGRFSSLELACNHAEQMIANGVDIIDVGGESTRPGAKAVSEQQELDRVIPLIEAIKSLGKPISIDTSKPKVMAEAVKAGAVMINDVRALREKGALEAAAKSGAEICLMHMQGEPKSMQQEPHYIDPVLEVSEFLRARLELCLDVGIAKDKICLDPGFGFGKNLQHNCLLMQQLEQLQQLECPLLIGVSRKGMIGEILDLAVEERMVGSVTAGVIALTKGAKILRVHDVKETRQAMDIYRALV